MSQEKKHLPIDAKRHSLSHVCMQAIRRLWPDAIPGVGPFIEDGFYHDFDSSHQVTEKDLAKTEQEIKKIIKENQKFERSELAIDEAIVKIKSMGYKYTAVLAEDLKKEGEIKVSFYKNGEFENMCKGPHIESTGLLNPDGFKLTRLAGSYWKGNEKNKMLQRVYGVYFDTKKELDEYFQKLEEAKKRDHRELNKVLNLFYFSDNVGLGLPLWKPNGALMWHLIENYSIKEHLKNGYQLVRSPHIGNKKLWETSGHWGFYSDSMYPPMDASHSLTEDKDPKKKNKKDLYLLKPMNCPFHVELYRSESRSYRNLPIRWAERGYVYRFEQSGELAGLSRVRGFTQDDAHIICTKDQAKNELKKVIKFIQSIYAAFGMTNFQCYLSLRDPQNKTKYAGNDEGWDFAEKMLAEVADEIKLNYVKEVGEAAFYGPKFDFKFKDAIGREWQCSTLQFDFNLPERFDLTYIDENGKKVRPFMLHRALFGSFERFFSILIEHYAGNFPLWICPVQVKLLPISKDLNAYAEEIAEKFRSEDIRVEVDSDNETLGNKIRQAKNQKVPYIVVIGKQEKEAGTLAVNQRGVEKKKEVLNIQEFIDRVKEEIKNKVIF